MYQLIIIGAGAAGLMAALTASHRTPNIAVLEAASQPGQKLALSGGGKANFSNTSVTIKDYFGQNPKFALPSLQALTTPELISYLQQHHLQYEERDHGRLFCLQPAQQLVTALQQDCLKSNINFFFNTPAQDIQAHDFGFTITTPKRTFQTKALVLALGSPAWPQCGATADGYRLAKSLGHKIIPAYPVLTPLLMPNSWPLAGLAGISCPVQISFPQLTITDDLLFTHQGLSGPAILTASCYWQTNTPLHLNFLPNLDLKTMLDAQVNSKLLVKNLLKQHLPDRLALLLLPPQLQDRKIAGLSRQDRTLICQAVHNYPTLPKARSSFSKAEATGGGVDTQDLDAQTLMSKLQRNLFICGELLDITGRLGGYNLHFAFASGKLAGKSISAT